MDADETQPGSLRDHLANERTLLAWIRTGLTVVGLGLVVGRLLVTGAESSDWAVPLGALLVVTGAGTTLAGLWRYLSVERHIRDGATDASSTVNVVMTLAVVVASLLLLAYLALVPVRG